MESIPSLPGTSSPSDSSFATSHSGSYSPCNPFKRHPSDSPSNEDSPPSSSYLSYSTFIEDSATSFSSSKIHTKALLADSSRFIHLV